MKNTYTHKLLQDFSGMHNIVHDGDPPVLREDVAAWLDNSFDADHLLLTISGSDWIRYCAINRDPKFDITLPERPDLELLCDAQLIPFAEMRSQLAHGIRHVLRGIEALRKYLSPNIPIWYIASPPANPDNDSVRRTKIFRPEDIERHGVTDPVLRLKMYLLHSAIVAETCASNGILFVPPPKDVMTEHGFLAPECAGDDCFHANPRYGWHVIRDIEQRLASQ